MTADTTDFSFAVRDADEAKSYGAEFGAQWLLRHDLQLYGNVGLLRARITRYPGSGFEGNEQPFAPSVTAAGGLSWTTDKSNAGLGVRYSGSYYSGIDNDPRSEVDPYWIADAQLGRRWGAFMSMAPSRTCSTAMTPCRSAPAPRQRTILRHCRGRAPGGWAWSGICKFRNPG